MPFILMEISQWNWEPSDRGIRWPSPEGWNRACAKGLRILDCGWALLFNFVSSDLIAIQVEIMWKRYSDFSLYDTVCWPLQVQLFGGRFDSVPSEIIYLTLENEIKRQHKQLAFSRFGSPRGKVDVDRSQSLFYFIPQEKNIKVKLAWLGARQRSR